MTTGTRSSFLPGRPGQAAFKGVAATKASGKVLGRPTAITADQAADGWLTVASPSSSPVRSSGTSRAPVSSRTRLIVLDDGAVLPGESLHSDALAVGMDDIGETRSPTMTILMVHVPGLVAEQLAGHRRRRGPPDSQRREDHPMGTGYSVRVTAPLSVHTAMVDLSATALPRPARSHPPEA
ncbi:hypothetical protein ABZT03_41030 [Streptomyces sp. NPDC005574]|uniref:hypothetical protein n=1 Tax=Streptomyces sp. NPDC005574 TaxID=3156891 RepID=UPI00339E4879